MHCRMAETLGQWMAGHWAEVAGVILGLGYVFLSVRQNLLTWPLGILSSLAYVYVFSQSKFYAGMGLQGYYVMISIYGWIHWKRGEEQPSGGLKVSHITTGTAAIAFLAAGTLCAGMYWALRTWTDSPVPFADAFTTSLGVVATWMMARKILENWIVWLVSDSVAILLYGSRELWPTAFLYLVYWSMAIAGYRQWKLSIGKQEGI